MAISKIKKGDEVIVTTGKDKGRQGTVLRVYDDERLLVENINVVKKHQKPNPNAGVGGGIIEKEMPLHMSNWPSFTKWDMALKGIEKRPIPFTAKAQKKYRH